MQNGLLLYSFMFFSVLSSSILSCCTMYILQLLYIFTLCHIVWNILRWFQYWKYEKIMNMNVKNKLKADGTNLPYVIKVTMRHLPLTRRLVKFIQQWMQLVLRWQIIKSTKTERLSAQSRTKTTSDYYHGNTTHNVMYYCNVMISHGFCVLQLQ